ADNSITRRFGGTGLGTTIAKDLTELMGGCIHLESSKGKGSTFTIEVPFERQVEQNDERTLSQLHVLLLATPDGAQPAIPLLKRWDVNFTMAHDETEVLSMLVDAWSIGQGFDATIIYRDALHCNPELIARAVLDKQELAGLKMILIEAKAAPPQAVTMITTAFTAILQQPLQEALLFNMLHAASIAHRSGDVISMADILQRRQAAKALHILVAEDNPVNQEVIRTMLEKAGHRVCLAEDGEQALEALAGDALFDLVLLDMNMPKVSGLEALKQFRFMDTSASVPVLMLSADALPATIRDCMQAGANDYITKPVQMAALLEKIAAFTDTHVSSEYGNSTDGLTAETDALLNKEILEELFKLIVSAHKRQHLLQSFTTSGEEHLVQLDSYARQGQISLFLDRVHGFKGSAATLGVQVIVSLCVEIESRQDMLHGDDLASYATQLRSTFKQGCTALDAYLQRIH
ncbi:MAG: response regulator, partial [Mariprofundus sp.]|nr:response regulator [Mariprofundus sp.]